MALSVTVSRVKEKCSITGTDFDATIQNLINEFLPVITYMLEPAFIEDVSITGPATTLNLGAAEVICGEFLAQRMREQGALDKVTIADVSVFPARLEDSRALDLITEGWKRLAPFIKREFGRASEVGTAGGKFEVEDE